MCFHQRTHRQNSLRFLSFLSLFQDQPPAALSEIADPDFKQLIEQLLGPPDTRPTAADLLLDSFLLQESDEVSASQRESTVEFRPVENWIPVQFPRVDLRAAFHVAVHVHEGASRGRLR